MRKLRESLKESFEVDFSKEGKCFHFYQPAGYTSCNPLSAIYECIHCKDSLTFTEHHDFVDYYSHYRMSHLTDDIVRFDKVIN